MDDRLIGIWTRTESHSDPSYAFSYAIDYHMTINSDGTIELSTRSMGGTDTVMGETNTNTMKGFWTTHDGVFYTSDTGEDPWTFIGQYTVDIERIMFRQPQGNQLWYRTY